MKSKSISVTFDNRDNFKPGYKFNEYEIKGVPLRIGIGPRDLENKQVELARRDTLEKTTPSLDRVVDHIPPLLEEIQNQLYQRAQTFRKSHTTIVDDFSSFNEVLNKKGGFISAHWDGTAETEEAIKKATKATLRCIPMEGEIDPGICVYSGKPSQRRVLFAKAY